METKKLRIAIIGGGAAGFFSAITMASTGNSSEITIFEKGSKVLQKVKISGGGRCNVTHNCFIPYKLAENYPRGEKQLKDLFKKFQAKDVVEWFEKNGVALKTEDDGRIFPVSNNSQSIIDCFIDQTYGYNIQLKLNHALDEILKTDQSFELKFSNGSVEIFDKVLVAVGGFNKIEGYHFIEKIGHKIIPPIPSLFTFNDGDRSFVDLAGVSVTNAIVKITSTKFEMKGPMIITHWGLSGPAIIKLSSWAASYLASVGYEFVVLVNWVGIEKEDDLKQKLNEFKVSHPKKKITSNPLFSIPFRLWNKLCDLALINENRLWGDISAKEFNKLLENLYRCKFNIRGKTTFKEEFVTCGGVDLNEIDMQSMESKIVSGLFFAGEVINIDGVTGGFNFQSAWTTGWIAGKNIINR